MKLLVAMTTADRSPRRNYVGETLQQLRVQGVTPDRIHVFASAPDISWLPSWMGGQCVLYVPTKVLTRNENGLALLNGVPKCDWVVHLEDDVLFCQDFVGSVERWLTKHANQRKVYTFCVFKGQPPDGVETWDQPRTSYGCMAVAMRYKHLKEFRDFVTSRLPTWRRSMSAGWRTSGFDMLMRTWAGEPFLASNPSFVQHIGNESLTHAFRNRPITKTPHFAGTTWTYPPERKEP